MQFKTIFPERFFCEMSCRFDWRMTNCISVFKGVSFVNIQVSIIIFHAMLFNTYVLDKMIVVIKINMPLNYRQYHPIKQDLFIVNLRLTVLFSWFTNVLFFVVQLVLISTMCYVNWVVVGEICCLDGECASKLKL